MSPLPAVSSVFALVALVLTSPAPAQQKQDSITVVLAIPRDSAADAVVAAFSAAGMAITESGTGLVVADLGEMTAMGYGSNQMIVRAAIFTRAGSTYVVMRGEAKSLSYPQGFTSRITNKQKGPYQKVWRKMEAVAAELSSPVQQRLAALEDRRQLLISDFMATEARLAKVESREPRKVQLDMVAPSIDSIVSSVIDPATGRESVVGVGLPDTTALPECPKL